MQLTRSLRHYKRLHELLVGPFLICAGLLAFSVSTSSISYAADSTTAVGQPEPSLESMPAALRTWWERERMNDYFETAAGSSLGQTDVSSDFQANTGKVFALEYMEIPLEDLEVMDTGLGTENLRSQIIVERDGKRYFRFFIHPESRYLYEPLIQKYSIGGRYNAVATASTRSLFAWNPANSQETPFIAKVSLAKQQGGLGRIIPGWEVRRSTLLSLQIGVSDSDNMIRTQSNQVIPEILGAYVRASEGIGSYIDKNQGEVFEHGLIIREITDILNEGTDDIYPFFALLARRGRDPPLLVEWQRASGLSWKRFLERRIIGPFIDTVSPMILGEGLLPQIHSQNFLVRIDSSTKQITKVYHRDLGSFGVDLQSRWMQGRSMTELRVPNAITDFKYYSVDQRYHKIFHTYFGNVFGTGGSGVGGKVLRDYFKNYNHHTVTEMINRRLRTQIKKHWRIDTKVIAGQHPSLTQLVRDYHTKMAPELSPARGLTSKQTAEITRFVDQRKLSGDVFPLERWKFPKGFQALDFHVSDYGIVFRSKGKDSDVPQLALFTEKDPPLLRRLRAHVPRTQSLQDCKTTIQHTDHLLSP